MESKRDKKKQAYKEKQRLASLKKEQGDRLKKLSLILNKDKDQRTDDENKFLEANNSFISIAESRLLKQNSLKLRTVEIEDDFNILNDKIDRLIKLINQSKHIIVYTGAGISTSTGIIPDYRGPNGVWTLLNKKGSILKTQDLALADPTFTHMALAKLVKKDIIKHILSQNVDGLHLRSGVPVDKLSEIHGNMFVEVCLNCSKVYYRDFDVTEHTKLRYHKTGRYCLDCIKLNDKNIDYELIDTIVHFGEKGYLKYPLNWDGVMESLKETDLIICLGSSLKVLKNYSCLWPRKVNIVVVNLQWTPKDKQALIKINCKCDKLMELIMNKLQINVDLYDKDKDQLKNKFIPLNDNEQLSCRRHQLFTIDNSIKIESTDEKDEKLSTSLLSPSWFGKGLKGFKK